MQFLHSSLYSDSACLYYPFCKLNLGSDHLKAKMPFQGPFFLIRLFQVLIKDQIAFGICTIVGQFLLLYFSLVILCHVYGANIDGVLFVFYSDYSSCLTSLMEEDYNPEVNSPL